MLGSICGIFELVRNTLNLWAKCAKYPKLEIAFSIMGFVSAFMYIFNFILMNLWRFEHEGKVCSGDYLEENDRKEYAKMDGENGYMIKKGFFIYVIICVIYGMIGLVICSISLIACTFKYQKTKRSSSFRPHIKEKTQSSKMSDSLL